MRYPTGHKEQTRRRILDAAAAVFRRQGFAATGVDQVMAEAGLTPGGFYSHFGSKAELLAEAMTHALRNGPSLLNPSHEGSGPEWLSEAAQKYLSREHRSRPETGCSLPPLLAEVGRADAATKQAFESVFGEAVDSLAERLGTDRAGVYPLLATLIGGLSLARAVNDERLAEEILSSCRSFLEGAAGPPGAPEPSSRPKRGLTQRRGDSP